MSFRTTRVSSTPFTSKPTLSARRYVIWRHICARAFLKMVFSYLCTPVLFCQQDRENPDVSNRLGTIDRRYQELLELAEVRKQRLLNALALYQLYNEADNVEQWIAEKV